MPEINNFIKVIRAEGVGNDRIFVSNTSVNPSTPGTPTNSEISASVGLLRDTIVYYNGTDLSTTNPTYVYHIDKSGNLTLLKSPDMGGRIREVLTVVGINTINNLSSNPTSFVEYSINGVEVDNNGITNVGQVVTVNAVNLSHNVEITDIVTAKYLA